MGGAIPSPTVTFEQCRPGVAEEKDLYHSGSPGRAGAAHQQPALQNHLAGLALATILFRNRFTHDEQEAGKAAWVLGLSFITEGAIPFAANDPFRVIPSIMVGSAVTGALSMLFQCQLRVPHGGAFVLLIPNVVTNLPLYLLAILVGTAVTTGMLFVLKRPLAVEDEVAAPAAVQTAEVA